MVVDEDGNDEQQKDKDECGGRECDAALSSRRTECYEHDLAKCQTIAARELVDVSEYWLQLVGIFITHYRCCWRTPRVSSLP